MLLLCMNKIKNLEHNIIFEGTKKMHDWTEHIVSKSYNDLGRHV